MQKYKVIKQWEGWPKIWYLIESWVFPSVWYIQNWQDETWSIPLRFLMKNWYIEEVKEILVPDSWDDIDNKWSWYVDQYSNIIETNRYHSEEEKNTRPNKELAEACLALSQLAQLRNETWRRCGDWKPDWKNEDQEKFWIFYMKWVFEVSTFFETQNFLVFPIRKVRDEFLKKHKDLIEQAKELL